MDRIGPKHHWNYFSQSIVNFYDYWSRFGMIEHLSGICFANLIRRQIKDYGYLFSELPLEKKVGLGRGAVL